MTQFFELSSLFSNPAAIIPNSEHQKLIQEFERVKESENGWKECAQLIVSEQQINDQTRFFCMQIIENYLKTRYKSSASQSDQMLLRQFMSSWLQLQINRKANEKNFLTKKVAQLFALVSLIDFPSRWPSFFTDLVETFRWSAGNADFYLKVLTSIESEIVDRDVPRTNEEQLAITFYKDAIRERCVAELVESWFALLKENTVKSPEITCQTLDVIGAYISWIDINLIVNSRFVEFFVYGLGLVELRETTCKCLEQVIDKRMEIRAKLKLVDYLWKDVLQASAVSLEQQINLSNDEQDNCDYLLKFGKLLNTIGENLFDGWQKNNKKEPLLANECVECLQNKIPYVLQVFNHTDDDISESVSEYCMHYISILKTTKIQTREQQSHIESMFNIIISKTKYDSSFNFDNEGEDEAMFLEYRKNIKLVFDSIAQLDNDFVLASIKKLVLEITANWPSKSYADIENALYLLYLIGEAIPSSQGNHFQVRSPKSDCLSEMIQATITSNLVQNPHRIVKLQYFENITRYFRFFQLYPHLIEQVVDHFIGPHGLHNPDPKLRSRVSYLFSRYTKDLKNLLSNFIEKILNTIQDLLVISSPMQTPQTFGQDGPLSTDDQLFLFETVSVLIVSSNLEPKIKAQLMKSLLSPLVSSFSLLLNKYCEISDEKTKLVYAKSLNAAMLVASRVSKGFSNQIKVKDCECVELFLEILRIFLPSINVTTHKNLIHVGFRQYLHRMIVCLDNEVFDYLPLTIEHLIKTSNEPKDMYDLIPLLNQIVNKYKQQIVRFMQTILMQFINSVTNFTNSLPSDIINNLFKASSTNLSNLSTNSLNSNTTTNFNNNSIDPQFIVDVQQLYKAYFQFLLNIINNDVVDIISEQQANDIYKIFFTLLQGAQIGSQDISKSCFQVIKKLITIFVEKPDSLPNFVQYTIENIVPCCIQIVLIKSVDLNDAQQVLVFNEIGSCLTVLYRKYGEDFIKYLESTLLPNLQINPQVTEAFVQTIKSNNPKGFKALRESITINK